MCLDYFILGFNSSVVRLKGLTKLSPSKIKFSFNSSVVRLKDAEPSEQIIITMFQFQCGSIKSLGAAAAAAALFQFQCGSIKRQMLLCLIAFLLSFNSSVVRLKVIIDRQDFSFEYVSIPVWFD